MEPTIYEVRVYPNGLKKYRVNGELHRDSGPAIEDAGGKGFYFCRGTFCGDGPAVEEKKEKPPWYTRGQYIDSKGNLRVGR